MKGIRETAEIYRKRFKVGEFKFEKAVSEQLKISIVIPAFDEDLETTLSSLGECVIANPEEVEVILVINHSENADKRIKVRHQHQYDQYHNAALTNGLSVLAIKAFDLPSKTAGVGLARKIGMDEALIRFAKIEHNGLIVCLDADCEVSSNYLSSMIQGSFSDFNTFCINYEHPLDEVENNEHKNFIKNYEQFLHYYEAALNFAGYPYPYQTIGSSMAVRATVYAQCGGMNTRKAGEDFYFLHKVFPYGKVVKWMDCTVFPSPRFSDRVPFGTGRAMYDSAAGSKDFSKVYNPQIFIELKKWLEQKQDYFLTAKLPSGIITEKFIQLRWEEQLRKLRDRSSSEKQFLKNFNFWFDGFKILKLVHLMDEECGRMPAEIAFEVISVQK